jgi:hypothetical protein
VEIIGESNATVRPAAPRAPDDQLADGVEVARLSIDHDDCVAQAGLAHHVLPSLTAHALEVREIVFDGLIRDISAYGCTGSPVSE